MSDVIEAVVGALAWAAFVAVLAICL